MKTFEIEKDYQIVCEVKKTRNGFKHEATLLRSGYEIERTKICYYNRTWERFEFESVLRKLLDKTDILTKRRKNNFIEKASDKNREEIKKEFGLIGKIAGLGEVLGQNKKEKNDFKARIIKAGLENKGLIMPDDWDELDEKTKETRLNKVIAELGS